VHDQRTIEQDFLPSGRMPVQFKDLRNVLSTVNEIVFDAPITTLFEQLQTKGIE
jgi:3-hydroxyisobutyrate dehydrogenase-like beta-hydroxyacid dehydrogenase